MQRRLQATEQRIRSIFRQFDCDGDGKISLDEMLAGAQVSRSIRVLSRSLVVFVLEISLDEMLAGAQAMQ